MGRRRSGTLKQACSLGRLADWHWDTIGEARGGAWGGHLLRSVAIWEDLFFLSFLFLVRPGVLIPCVLAGYGTCIKDPRT